MKYFISNKKNHPATFQDRWPQMKRVVLKILRQEPTSQIEWQNLFTYLSLLNFIFQKINFSFYLVMYIVFQLGIRQVYRRYLRNYQMKLLDILNKLKK
jgi:hypothetical protein